VYIITRIKYVSIIILWCIYVYLYGSKRTDFFYSVPREENNIIKYDGYALLTRLAEYNNNIRQASDKIASISYHILYYYYIVNFSTKFIGVCVCVCVCAVYIIYIVPPPPSENPFHPPRAMIILIPFVKRQLTVLCVYTYTGRLT